MTGPYPPPPGHNTGPYPTGGYVVPGQGPVPDISAPQNVPSGPYPTGGYVVPGQAPVPDISAPQNVPTGPYPAPTGTGPYPVPLQDPAAAPPGGWSYGPPPGVRPDLLNTPIGQAGALANSDWQAKASRGASFPVLVLAELRKLVGTFSDRLIIALSPLLLVGVTLLGVQLSVTLGPSSAASQLLGLLIAVEAGHLMVHTTIIKTMCGEWHYRSIQLTLLLQPRRLRFAAAQVSMLGLVWIALTVLQFLVFYPIATSWIGHTDFQLYLDQRMGWVFGLTALGTLLSLLFCLVVTYLMPNPTAAVTVYFLGKFGVGLFLANPILNYINPYAALNLATGSSDDVLAACTGTALWIALLWLGIGVNQRRDAR
ncbi:hypothetical protein GCM10010174_85430 [Kutzneria viridogrisea]|uniref:Uncharacterized protein n=1 Tax=Kutzneria viridogrisea TaxID=47990 RepID=A0ABR6BWC4_9PSEU|nr:hypothetical protein [Kutzneria viridogrisea]